MPDSPCSQTRLKEDGANSATVSRLAALKYITLCMKQLSQMEGAEVPPPPTQVNMMRCITYILAKILS